VRLLDLSSGLMRRSISIGYLNQINLRVVWNGNAGVTWSWLADGSVEMTPRRATAKITALQSQSVPAVCYPILTNMDLLDGGVACSLYRGSRFKAVNSRPITRIGKLRLGEIDRPLSVILVSWTARR
jgi:hypothetical protein